MIPAELPRVFDGKAVLVHYESCLSFENRLFLSGVLPLLHHTLLIPTYCRLISGAAACVFERRCSWD